MAGYVYYDYSRSWNAKYREMYSDDHDREIIRKSDEKLVVRPSVLDYQVSNGHMLGILLPSKSVMCGYSDRVVLENRKTYFVLDMATDEAVYFDTKQEFENKAASLGLERNHLRLDYLRFENVWKRYSRYYDMFSIYDSCEQWERSVRPV